MSSYSFGDIFDQGPPHNADYSTADVPINTDGSCGGGWVCEHRWPSIRGMPLFRNAVAGTDIQNYYNQNDVVAFSRGNKVKIASDNTTMKMVIIIVISKMMIEMMTMTMMIMMRMIVSL